GGHGQERPLDRIRSKSLWCSSFSLCSLCLCGFVPFALPCESGDGSMQTRRIGSLTVSIVGLGCNHFGGRLDADGTARVVNAALDAGINFFDTADIYGGTKSEEFIGRALKNRRGEAVIATKFGGKIDEERRGARPEYVRRACDDSLRRLAIEQIDLYQLH